MSQRVYYVDWLRVLAVLLLFPFHTWRVFNAGDPFYVKAGMQSQAINYVIGFIDVWHMPLLFMLAGASTYFAMRKRTAGRYAGERFMRLFLPLVFGTLVLIPPQTWYGGRFNSGYRESFWRYLTSGDFLKWNIQGGGDYYGGFGLGHLWFILFLFLISLMALPVILWWRSANGARFAQKFGTVLGTPWGWAIAAGILVIGDGLPSPVEDKAFFYFMFLFLLGYAAMSSEAFADSAERFRWIALPGGIALSLFFTLSWRFRDSLPDPSWGRAGLAFLATLGVWMTIVGLIGFGRVLLDRASVTLSYLGEASYPLYILHQTVIVVAAFYLVRIAPTAPWVWQWLVLLGVVVPLTFGLYEIVRRVPALRFLFGMKPREADAPTTVTQTAPVPAE